MTMKQTNAGEGGKSLPIDQWPMWRVSHAKSHNGAFKYSAFIYAPTAEAANETLLVMFPKSRILMTREVEPTKPAKGCY